ncbi:MAG: SulP family inorganic anion transporter [Legionella sp.]|nr:SulP family inorganic anion transporter [Legionella sp.]
MIAIHEAYRAGLLGFKNWLPNLVAGLIVGVVALPLAMAFAIASGVSPQQGLYTAIIAGFIVGLFGGSRVQIAGPTGAFVVILASITAKYGISGLQIATLLAGGMLVLMGLTKFGNVIKFIPDPVIVGFTAGIGIIIFVGEWKDFFGLSVSLPLDAPFYQKIHALFMALPHLNWATTGMGMMSLGLILLAPRFLKRIPAPLLALVIATLVQTTFQFKGIATLGSAFGTISSVLPSFQLPNLSIPLISQLIGPAFTIALLGAIESLLSATAADGMINTRHDANQELIGQGLANLLTPLFGGFAATGAIARTATNIRNGGNSPLAAIVHSITLLLIIIFLAPFASAIPLCTLAAILFVVAFNMSDMPHFIYTIKRAPQYDVIILLVTFFLTIFTDLVVAVNTGVILAILLFIRRMNQTIIVETHSPIHFQHEIKEHDISLPEDLLVYTIQGPLFFGAAEKIERALAVTHTDPSAIILRLKNVPFMDMTGLTILRELVEQFHHRGIKVYMCEANAEVRRKLIKVNMLRWLEKKRLFKTFPEALKCCSTSKI